MNKYIVSYFGYNAIAKSLMKRFPHNFHSNLSMVGLMQGFSKSDHSCYLCRKNGEFEELIPGKFCLQSGGKCCFLDGHILLFWEIIGLLEGQNIPQMEGSFDDILGKCIFPRLYIISLWCIALFIWYWHSKCYDHHWSIITLKCCLSCLWISHGFTKYAVYGQVLNIVFFRSCIQGGSKIEGYAFWNMYIWKFHDQIII